MVTHKTSVWCVEVQSYRGKGGSVMEVHHPVFYVSLGHMQNSMRSSVTLKLKLTLTLTLTLTDTGGAVLTIMLGYRPGELP